MEERRGLLPTTYGVSAAGPGRLKSQVIQDVGNIDAGSAGTHLKKRERRAMRFMRISLSLRCGHGINHDKSSGNRNPILILSGFLCGPV